MSGPKMEAAPDDYLLVFMTAGSIEEATQIAEGLVDSRLAACVNLLPQIRSIYRWQEKVEDQEECLLLAKTTRNNFHELCDAVRGLHSYDVPEIIAVSIEAGDADYLKWVWEAVS